ncbi:hypothetical protein BC938DRAFT_474768 [Jimgerdemannia flammicorona]|uniref:Uncharacterized protein n=1 Tax=Jimgerdemannia flammicorona TaxID=994334 RepID=A0A433QZH0_9FUNG|nr:hypothetical protein BC938DRAFT_474768 [Jimgerdemannia flammicorona]
MPTNTTHPAPLMALLPAVALRAPLAPSFCRARHTLTHQTSLTNIGGMMGLAPNGLRVLSFLGLADKIIEQASVAEEMTIAALPSASSPWASGAATGSHQLWSAGRPCTRRWCKRRKMRGSRSSMGRKC